MKLSYQGGQIDQVSHSKVRPSGRYDKERVFVLHARPARWQRRNITEAVAIEEQVVTPLNPPFDEVDRLPEQRMKGVSDADRCSHLSGAACSWSIGRTLGALARPTSSCEVVAPSLICLAGLIALEDWTSHSAASANRLTSEAVHATQGPALCVVAQGAKVVMLGSDVLEYDPARVLVFAVDLPISGQVTRASWRGPFLGFKLDLDPSRVAELAQPVYPHGVPKVSDNRGLYVGQATDGIIDAVTRLLELMSQPEDANLLGPLVVDEILIRLLRSPIGSRVAQIGQPKSGVQRVAEAVSWIRTHFAQPVTVDEMAASVHMSASSFHERFKAVTSMSPLQYQKVLRLHEARRFAVQPGVRPFLRERADERHRSPARGRVRCGQVLTSSGSSGCR